MTKNEKKIMEELGECLSHLDNIMQASFGQHFGEKIASRSKAVLKKYKAWKLTNQIEGGES